MSDNKKIITKDDLEFLGKYVLHTDSVRLLPHVFCITNNVVVLNQVDPKSKDPVLIGTSMPSRYDTMELVSMKFGGRRVEAVYMEPTHVTKAINKGFGFDSTIINDDRRVDAVREQTEDRSNYREPPVTYDSIDGFESVDLSIEEDRPIIEIVNNLLLDSLRRGATDIHLENERKEVQVRYKIDGMLYKVGTPIHKDVVEEVISRIKIMSNLDISEKRAPQDGRILFRTLRNGQDYDVPFRVSILPGPYGEEAVLRVLDKSMAPINLELLGFTHRDLKLYRSLIHNPQGMILVTGPTGSGKTTTLYATLKEINTPYNKILSAEDPIEYNLDGVNQKQISNRFGFADMARAFLRHDPDIILIGEIRDSDTADVAIKAAQTGHLILSTIHTNDSISTISRLHSLGISINLISGSLLGALSQRLVRRICPKCKGTYTPDPSLLKIFENHTSKEAFIQGAGCDYCNRTGFHDRLGIFELFYVDDEIQDMIQQEALMSEILSKALIKGMVPLTMDGILKVEQDITTIEELVRVVPRRQILAQLQRRYEEF